MRRFILLFAFMAMVFVGCSNPASGSTENNTVVRTPADVSPYEYVKPDCVNLSDYTYVGDYIFADSMNFAEWKYSNSQTNYTLAFEKIARVKNNNPSTRIYRCNHNDPNTEIPVIKATRYKIYVKTSAVESAAENTFVLNLRTVSFEDSYDGTRLRIKKLSGGSFTIDEPNDPNDTLSNYIAY